MIADPKSILVVDDDSDIREIIVMILEAEGFLVSSLDCGRDVLETVQRTSPDVLVLDVLLGDMDGRDICKAIKAAPDTSKVPVIIVSATHGRHTAHEKACGADDYLGKPFDLKDLVGRVRRLAS